MIPPEEFNSLGFAIIFKKKYMKKCIHFLSRLKLTIVIIGSFSFINALAQSEDKSYLKLSDPGSKGQVIDFVPDSKFGLVVTLSNLSEALKNPLLYKSARFNNSGLTDFPEQIFLFSNLEELDISQNAITVLPSKLNELKKLKELHVNKNSLTSLGTEITSCATLEVLQIQNNPLKSITEEIGNMTTLKELTIGEIARNCELPAGLWGLINLTKLKITNAFLTEIPAAVSGLKQLEELCLANNLIAMVPEEIYTLKNITYINLGYNKIKSVSSSIKALENLDYLGVYYNPLSSLPAEISSLKKLSFLSCWKTRISAKEIEIIRNKMPFTKVQDAETDIH